MLLFFDSPGSGRREKRSGVRWERMIMNTRREMAIALLGLPLLARSVQQEVETNLPVAQEPEHQPKPGVKLPPETKARPRPVPPPYSEAAARIISYTLYAEARGESFDGKMAVASVIKTRALRSNFSLAEICLQDQQFSCWNDLADVPEFYITGEGIQPDDLQARSECFGIAWVLLVSRRKWDYLTHFYNPDKATPDWAYDLKGTRIIGNHVFGYID